MKWKLSLPFALVALLFAAIPLAAAYAEDDPPQAEVRMWFMRFDSDFDRSQLPIDVSMLKHMESPSGSRIMPDGRISTMGVAVHQKMEDFKITGGGGHISFDRGDLQISRSPWARHFYELLAAPKLRVLRGQSAKVTVGEQVAYLEVHDTECGQCFKVVQPDDMFSGISVEMKFDSVRDDGLRFTNINIDVSRIVDREEVPGVPLDVGKPVIDSRRTELNDTVPPDTVAIIPLPQREDESGIMVFMTARLLE